MWLLREALGGLTFCFIRQSNLGKGIVEIQNSKSLVFEIIPGFCAMVHSILVPCGHDSIQISTNPTAQTISSLYFIPTDMIG